MKIPHIKRRSLRTKIGAVAALVSGLCITSPVNAALISFPDFSSTAGLIQTNGDALIVGTPGYIRLTEDGQTGQAGSAFLKAPLFISNTVDFSTSFTFQIEHNGNSSSGSDGFAFIIQPQTPNSAYLGSGGGSIGYLSNGGALLNQPYYAIEFDTHQNPSLFDPSDEHIALTRFTPGELPTSSSATPNDPTGYLASVDKLFADGLEHEVTIDYGQNAQNSLLRVFLDGVSVLNYDFTNEPVGLRNLFGGNIGFGFTAGAGTGTSTHRINSWSISVPSPFTAWLLGLGLIALAKSRRTADFT